MTTLLNPTNRLFVLARSGKRLPHLILVIILSFVFVLVAQIAGGIPAIAIIGFLSVLGGDQLSLTDQNALINSLLPDTALEQFILLVLAFGPIFLILWGWLALVEKRPLWTIGLERLNAGKRYLRGLLIGLLMFSASIGLSAMLGYIDVETGGPQPQGSNCPGWRIAGLSGLDGPGCRGGSRCPRLDTARYWCSL